MNLLNATEAKSVATLLFGECGIVSAPINCNYEHKNYLIPQVLTNVDHNMRFMTEETFGRIFKESAVKRTQFIGLKRNVNFIRKG